MKPLEKTGGKLISPNDVETHKGDEKGSNGERKEIFQKPLKVYIPKYDPSGDSIDNRQDQPGDEQRHKEIRL